MVIWCNARWTQRVWFLHSTSDGFKFDISRALQIRLFAPKELVPTGELNIVHRGEAMYNGKVLTRGQTWGEDIILSSVRLRKSNPSPNPNPNPTPTPNQVEPLAFPPQLLLSTNYFAPSWWDAAPRRIKNVVVLLEWCPNPNSNPNPNPNPNLNPNPPPGPFFVFFTCFGQQIKRKSENQKKVKNIQK